MTAGSPHAGLLTVNPNINPDNIATFSSISSAVNFADKDVNLANIYDIQITPGIYTNDFALVSRPITLEAIGRTGVTMLAVSCCKAKVSSLSLTRFSAVRILD
jgi:hypothetical protein